jgi:hypothetical protein
MPARKYWLFPLLSTRMSLFSVIQHQCVGKPTYLDVLPGDVLRYCIMPFLSWQDRIHVNMLTPAGDRTPPDRIPKERIIANQILICSHKLVSLIEKPRNLQIIRNSYISRGKRGGPSHTTVVQEIIKFLLILGESHNILLIQHNENFRRVVNEKIIEFSDPAMIAKIPRIYLRMQMDDAVQKLSKILASYPFIKCIKPQKYLSAAVTQNETAVLNEWRGVGRRYQGNIYTEIE